MQNIYGNILDLQQVVKTLTDDAQESEFDHAKEYFSLFFLTPQVFQSNLLSFFAVNNCMQEMLDRVRQKQTFKFEDYKTMLNLQCNTEQGEPVDRNYSMYLLDLQCLDMERMNESWSMHIPTSLNYDFLLRWVVETKSLLSVQPLANK